MNEPVRVILNSHSGGVQASETKTTLRHLFIAHGIRASIDIADNGTEAHRLAAATAASGAEVLVAGGGDGTVSTVAAEAYKHRKTLGVLPLGTLNNFSKDLGIPQVLGEAVALIAEGNVEMVDVGEVNGRMFLNNSSIGLYPRIVRRREHQRQTLGHGKWRAAFWAALRIFRVSPFIRVRIQLDGKEFVRKTPFVFVGNNEYVMELYNIGRRERLDSGKLSVYFLHRGGRWGVVLLLMHTIFGSLKQWKDFEEVSVESLTIDSHRRRLSVAFDGEVTTLETPLNYRIVPQALKVITPTRTD